MRVDENPAIEIALQEFCNYFKIGQGEIAVHWFPSPSGETEGVHIRLGSINENSLKGGIRFSPSRDGNGGRWQFPGTASQGKEMGGNTTWINCDSPGQAFEYARPYIEAAQLERAIVTENLRAAIKSGEFLPRPQ